MKFNYVLMFSIADWFCLTDQLVSQCKFFVKLMCFCVACEPYKLGFFIISMKIVWQWFFLLYLIYWPFNLVDLFFLLSKISNVALYTCTHIDTFISQALFVSAYPFPSFYGIVQFKSIFFWWNHWHVHSSSN